MDQFTRSNLPFSLVAAVGLVPSLAFYFWVERNCSLPAAVSNSLAWPWLDLDSLPVWARATIDSFLILSFGALHSLLANTKALKKWTAQGTRSVYVLITGATLLLVMGLWQSTGIVLWAPRMRPEVMALFSNLLYWPLLAGALTGISKFGTASFLGLRAPQEISSQRLLRTGIYARMRHPVYFFTLMAFAFTPFMTLDRAVVILSLLAYLSIAIPIEEMKLVRQFGKEYLSYRSKVRAILPF